jgi:homogentisate 1,2-dioxygenase
MGLIYGEYAGRSDEFQPGGVSFECGFVPHGVGKLALLKLQVTVPVKQKILATFATKLLRKKTDSNTPLY